MRKKIGTVIKINDRKAAIMTRDCEMLYIKKQPGMYPGLEIQFGTNEIISARSRLNLTIKVVSSVAAIFIFVFFISNFLDRNDNYTYICIDGKSSIELAVDSNMKVVNVSSIDEKIQEKLIKIGLESKSLKNALSDLLANSNSFFNEETESDDFIIISAYSKDGKNNGEFANENIESVLTACKNTVEELNSNFSYYFIGISEDARKLAEKNNISAGRYYVYEIAQEQGENISIEQAKEMKVGELVKIVSMPHSLFANKAVTNDFKNPDVIKDPKATPIPTVKKETLPPKNNAAKSDKNMNTPEANASKETPDIKIPDKDNDKEDTTGVKPAIGDSYSADNSTTEDKTLSPTPTPTRRTGTKVSATPARSGSDNAKASATPVPTKTNNTKVSPTPAKSDSNEDKAPPAPAKPDSDEGKTPPAPAKPDSDEEKTPPAPAKPDSGEEKAPPAPAKPDTDEEKTPPAPAKPESDEEKVPPAPAKPDSDEAKTPPVPAKSYSEDTKAPPVPAKSDEEKAPPAPVKSDSDEEKDPPVPAKSDEEKESST